MIQHQHAFSLKDGRMVEEYTLERGSLRVTVLNLGATLTGIYCPDRMGKVENILIGYAQAEDYADNQPFFGTTVGPMSGRISGGAFEIDGHHYVLEQNFKSHNLHGGSQGFHSYVWQPTTEEKEEEDRLTLMAFHADGVGGFPGNLMVKVHYVLRDNELVIEYEATTDKPALINMTNHAYFNLSGDGKRTVADHRLVLPASKYGQVNGDTLPNGPWAPVEGTAMDFRYGKRLDEVLTSDEPQIALCGGLDHPFLLDDEGEVSLYESKSGRNIIMSTNQPAVVVYTMNGVDGLKGMNTSIPVEAHHGICLEVQDPPNAVNHPHFDFTPVTPEAPYHRLTTLRFEVKR